MAYPSMTGFGSAQIDCPAGRLSLEIKSVNSRFFEFFPRMPDDFRWAESICREKIQSEVGRGKVELRLGLTRTDASLAKTQINPAGLASALRLAHEIRHNHPEIQPFSVSDLLKLPGVTIESALSQEEWQQLIQQVLDQTLEQFSQSRRAEGVRLIDTILDRLSQIEALCVQAAQHVPQAIALQQQKLADRLRDALQLAQPKSTNGTVGDTATGTLSGAPSSTAAAIQLTNEQAAQLEDRIRQETAVFGLRIDVAEELDRLRAHLASARQILGRDASGGQHSSAKTKPQEAKAGIGKRLDFLTQEMNREANTLGSKAASSELSTVSIEMKLLIEQIREQVQNLE
jgi:uncharacterized protein YicC (UPF0701 family)